MPDYMVGRSPPEADDKKNDPRSDFILLVHPCPVYTYRQLEASMKMGNC